MTTNIGYLIGAIIIGLSGLIGIILDVKYEITNPALYWTLGMFGGVAAVFVMLAIIDKKKVKK